MKLVGYKSNSTCLLCEGKCCKSFPGIAYPSDLSEVSSNSIMALLETGNWAIDFWTEDDGTKALFLRPRTKNGDIRVQWSEWGGECTFLTAPGCSLSFKDRPMSCRMLEPGEGDPREWEEIQCDIHGHTKEHGKNAWKPYQAELAEALALYQEET